MMKKVALVLGISILAIGCNPRESKLKDVVAMKQFLAESSTGCSPDSIPCARFVVNYPEFPGLDAGVQIALKNDILLTVRRDEKKGTKSLEEEGKLFVEEYEAFRKEAPDLKGGWGLEVDISLLLFGDSLLSLQVTDESYTGGAHGNFALTFINVRPSSGEVVRLEHLLKPGYEESLRKIGEEIFRKNRGLEDAASFEESGFTFVNNQFALNDNYGFSREGISFYFNSYEIAPYALGPTEVTIPYDRIREWLK